MKFIIMVACLVAFSGCISEQDYQFQLAQSQREVRKLEQENTELRLDLAGHQSLACRIITKMEDTATSAYDAAKPIVIQDAKDTVSWLNKKYQEHSQ